MNLRVICLNGLTTSSPAQECIGCAESSRDGCVTELDLVLVHGVRIIDEARACYVVRG